MSGSDIAPQVRKRWNTPHSRRFATYESASNRAKLLECAEFPRFRRNPRPTLLIAPATRQRRLLDLLANVPYPVGMEISVRHHRRRLDVRAPLSNRVKSLQATSGSAAVSEQHRSPKQPCHTRH